ncbi:MAG: hypothetical protein J2P37_27125, partial [Ktedonobacteraceae bacterium]|nr:hypothetical protein [Ktedonobacteraceae bacterium]
AFRLRSKPWSTGLLWRLVLRRRAFALHKARTPRDFATLKPIHDGLAAIVKTLEGNPVVAPPRFIAVLTGRVKLSWGELGRKMLKLLTFQRVFLLLFSVPVILALGIGEIPDDAKRMREFLAGPVVYQLLLAFLIVGAVWQGIWLVREGVPRLVQMRKSNNGLLIMVSLLAVLMTIGAIGFSSAPFLSLLSGQEPLQKAFKLYFNGGEASSNASGYDISVLALLAYLAAGFAAGAVVGWVVSTLADSVPILLGNPIAVGIAIALIAGVIYVGGSNEIQSLLTHTGGDNSGGKSEPPGGGKSEPPGNLYEKWQS